MTSRSRKPSPRATTRRRCVSSGSGRTRTSRLAWAQQLLFGELPGRDFVDPGMPLTYLISALVQMISPGPFSEAVACCIMLALAAAATFFVATGMTGSVAAGIGAALVEVALYPRLYSYPKILVPAVALLVIQRYLRQPDRLSLVLIALWTGAAVLLRHDLGVYTPPRLV